MTTTQKPEVRRVLTLSPSRGIPGTNRDGHWTLLVTVPGVASAHCKVPAPAHDGAKARLLAASLLQRSPSWSALPNGALRAEEVLS